MSCDAFLICEMISPVGISSILVIQGPANSGAGPKKFPGEMVPPGPGPEFGAGAMASPGPGLHPGR